LIKQPVPGDSIESLFPLFKRAITEFPWPQPPAEVKKMCGTYFMALGCLRWLCEPDVAIEILNRTVEDVERRIVAPIHVAEFHIFRVDWLLAAAWKFKEDEGRKGAYVAEAKGLMEGALRGLQGLQPEDWDHQVRG
jgi:hypothetical protein